MLSNISIKISALIITDISDTEQHQCREELNHNLPPPYRPSEKFHSMNTLCLQ